MTDNTKPQNKSNKTKLAYVFTKEDVKLIYKSALNFAEIDAGIDTALYTHCRMTKDLYKVDLKRLSEIGILNDHYLDPEKCREVDE